MRLLAALSVVLALTGCASDKEAQSRADRDAGQTLDKKIANVEGDAQMPPEVKAKLLADLRGQQAAKQAASHP